MLRCRRYLVVILGLVSCLFFVQLGLENWSSNGLAYRIADKANHQVDKNLDRSVRLAIESVTTPLKVTESGDSNPDQVTLKKDDVEDGDTVTSNKQSYHGDSIASIHDAALNQRLPETITNSVTKTDTPILVEKPTTIRPKETVPKNDTSGAETSRSLRAINATEVQNKVTTSPPAPPPPPTPTPTSRVVKKPRDKIKVKTVPLLTPEQTLRILGNAIAALPVVPSNKVIRVLVATYFRSGSTFLGDVLQQNWKTFYHFEPLHYMSDGLRIKPNQTEEALSLLGDILRCNYNTSLAANYLKWGSGQSHNFLIKRNRFLWVACRMQPKNCFRPDFARYICERAPIQVMKVTRLHLADVKRLVEDNPDLDLRVVNLVRDPRGTISSRKVLYWCNTTSCSDFRVLCSEMSADYDAFQKLATLKPRRFYQLRYEDLSMSPEIVARNMFAALDLPYSSIVSRFLKTNTRARPTDRKDPYSTRRDSSKAPFEWRNKLIFNEIKKIQIGCKNVMTNYSYEFLNRTRDLKGPPPVLKIGDKPWWIKP